MATINFIDMHDEVAVMHAVESEWGDLVRMFVCAVVQAQKRGEPLRCLVCECAYLPGSTAAAMVVTAPDCPEAGDHIAVNGLCYECATNPAVQDLVVKELRESFPGLRVLQTGRA